MKPVANVNVVNHDQNQRFYQKKCISQVNFGSEKFGPKIFVIDFLTETDHSKKIIFWQKNCESWVPSQKKRNFQPPPPLSAKPQEIGV